MKAVLKWFFWIVVAGALILVLCGVYLGAIDYGNYFRYGKGTLASVSLSRFAVDSLFTREWLSLGSTAGLKVDCGLLVPAADNSQRRYPVVILLGGKATGKHAIDYTLDLRNVIIASPDYPYTPRDAYTIPEFLAEVPEMRKAALAMIPSVGLLTDYLWSRPDVDTSRVILLGYSFGAPFVPCIAAHDSRASVVALVFGGGDLRGLIRHNVRRYRGPLVSDIAGLLGSALLAPLEPLDYIGRISPKPIVMINGAEDEQVPPKFAGELYLKAGSPKRIIWLEAHHVNPKNIELTELIVATLKAELKRMGMLTDEN